MVVGALVGLVCLCSGIAVFVAARSESGKKLFSAIDQTVKLAEGGINAPGAAELREAGCPQALVMDMKAAMEIADSVLDSGFEDDADMDYVSVTCSAPAGSNVVLPTCEAIAEVYAKAVPSDRIFVVEAQNGGQKPDCSKQFEGDGTFIKDMR